MRPQLIGHRQPVPDQVLAGTHQCSQRLRVRPVEGQRVQPAPVGAHHIGQHERVEPVVLVPRRPVTAPQDHNLRRRDHEHRQTRRQQRGDQRPVTALDAYPRHHPAGQHGDQAGNPGLVMPYGDPLHDLAIAVNQTRNMIVLRPVDARERWRRPDRTCDTQNASPAAQPSRTKHLVVPGTSLPDAH